MNTTLRMGLLAVLLFLAPVPGIAQVRPGGPPGQRGNRMEMERRLQQGFAQVIQQRLGLSDEELDAVQAVMNTFRDERRDLMRSQASLRHRLRDPALQDLNRTEAEELLDEMIRIQEAELDLYRRELEEMRGVLDAGEVILLIGLREEFGRRIQQLRQGRGAGRGGGPQDTTKGSPEWTGIPHPLGSLFLPY